LSIVLKAFVLQSSHTEYTDESDCVPRRFPVCDCKTSIY